MSKFFQCILDHNLFADWANTLDWLFDGNKFDSSFWTKGPTRALTNRIRRFSEFSEGNTYQHGAKKSLIFPNPGSHTIQAVFSSDSSESKDFIRHIRNGLAHGNTNCFSVNGVIFLEIKDYEPDGQTQTAYMCFPIDYVIAAYKKYCEVKQSYEKRNRK